VTAELLTNHSTQFLGMPFCWVSFCWKLWHQLWNLWKARKVLEKI